MSQQIPQDLQAQNAAISEAALRGISRRLEPRKRARKLTSPRIRRMTRRYRQRWPCCAVRKQTRLSRQPPRRLSRSKLAQLEHSAPRQATQSRHRDAPGVRRFQAPIKPSAPRAATIATAAPDRRSRPGSGSELRRCGCVRRLPAPRLGAGGSCSSPSLRRQDKSHDWLEQH